MLGMSVTATYRRDGAPFEYVMGLKAPGAILALPEAPRPPGPNGFGRVILETPDARALGQLLAGGERDRSLYATEAVGAAVTAPP